MVLRLEAREAAALVDEMRAAEDRVSATRRVAIEELLNLHQTGSELASSARGAAAQLQRGRWPRPDAVLEAHVSSLRSLILADQERQRREQAVEAAYAAAVVQNMNTLRELAATERFREALAWQNPNALRNAVDWLLARPAAANSDARKAYSLIAKYVQRYCTKNDIIGFFGPICWGELGSSHTTTVVPGPDLLRSRHVYIEDWAIDALAGAMSRDPDVRPYIAPRLLPTLGLRGDALVRGIEPPRELPAAVARVLAACDGETPAIEIARGVMEDESLEIESTDDVLDLLAQLEEKKLVTWTLEASALAYPERELRRLLQRIEVPAVRARCESLLSRLEGARDDIAASAGNVRAVQSAIERFNAEFEQVTQTSSSRNEGRTYAARTPVYEECVRDLHVRMGTAVTERLAPVLALLGQSARWFTYEVARRYREQLEARYRAIVPVESAALPYLQFMSDVEHLFPSQGRSEPILEVERELARRWQSLLAVDTTSRQVALQASAVRDSIMREFASPHPGWPSARYVSPDVMIAANSVEDIDRGDFTVVLGEVHLANSFMSRILAVHGPEPTDVLMAAHEHDVRVPRVSPLPASRDAVHRVTNLSWAAHDLDLETKARSWRPRAQVLRPADLVVEPLGQSLGVRDTRSGRVWDIIAFFDVWLWMMAANHFKPAPIATHVPRISIDGVVIAREQWRFTDGLEFRHENLGVRQFSQARAWAASHGMPRWVFVKVPEEPKPLFVDLESPIFIDMLSRILRKATSVTVTEMLPSIAETWLPDASGATYTCELRLVCVDPQHWEPAVCPT
jgi:hypothetical protein